MHVELHERLAESFYGYGVTREAEAALDCGDSALNSFLSSPSSPGLSRRPMITGGEDCAWMAATAVAAMTNAVMVRLIR